VLFGGGARRRGGWRDTTVEALSRRRTAIEGDGDDAKLGVHYRNLLYIYQLQPMKIGIKLRNLC
jgi:hypothetical protein